MTGPTSSSHVRSSDAQLPDTIEDLIMARIERLADGTAPRPARGERDRT